MSRYKLLLAFFALVLIIGSIFAVRSIGKQGVKVVADKSFSIDRFIEDSITKCGSGNERCYKEVLASYLKENGVVKAQALLAGYEKFNSKTNTPCHDLAHSLGSQAVKIYGQRALTGNFTICSWGYGHGVLLALLKSNGLDSMVDICADQPSEEMIGCYHGLGHALFQGGVKGGEVVKVCGGYGGVSYKIINPIYSNSGSCVDGWAMELFTEYNGARSYDKTAKHDREILEFELGLCGEIISSDKAICESEVFRNYVAKGEELKVMLPRLKEFKSFCSEGLSEHKDDGGEFAFICNYFLGAQVEESYYSTKSDFELVKKALQENCLEDKVCFTGFWDRYKNYNFSLPQAEQFCNSEYLGELCRGEIQQLKAMHS